MTVYHYTDLNALKAIFEGRDSEGEICPTFRLTHYRFMNDREEYGLQRHREFFRKEAESYPLATNLLLMSLEGSELIFPPYVLSFSARPDKLSQWRAYASGRSGVAIGLRETAFPSPGPEAVHYFSEPSPVSDSLLEHLENIERMLKLGTFDPEIHKKALRETIRSSILSKSEAFAEEEEFRSVMLDQKKEVGFYCGRFGMTPYVSLQLPKSAIESVWLSPLSDPESAVLGMLLYLSRTDYRDVEVFRSNASFRH